jgi:NADH-quinone oxidoreductase subunit J
MYVAQQVAESGGGTAEAVVFWVLAPVALASSLLMVLSRRAVHAALWLVLNFFCLAVFYAAQDAPFLAAVQVIVYTGAIMVLFLFVLMIVGVDNSDSLVETIRGHRIAALLAGLGFAGLVMGSVGGALLDLPDRGLSEANARGNVRAIGELLFREYVLAFELTSALLIVAALGAMVLTHRQRTGERRTQRELAIARFRGPYAHPTPLPGPGVRAGGQAAHVPALLPTGAPAEDSVPPAAGEGAR